MSFEQFETTKQQRIALENTTNHIQDHLGICMFSNLLAWVRQDSIEAILECPGPVALLTMNQQRETMEESIWTQILPIPSGTRLIKAGLGKRGQSFTHRMYIASPTNRCHTSRLRLHLVRLLCGGVYAVEPVIKLGQAPKHLMPWTATPETWSLLNVARDAPKSYCCNSGLIGFCGWFSSLHSSFSYYSVSLLVVELCMVPPRAPQPHPEV